MAGLSPFDGMSEEIAHRIMSSLDEKGLVNFSCAGGQRYARLARVIYQRKRFTAIAIGREANDCPRGCRLFPEESELVTNEDKCAQHIVQRLRDGVDYEYAVKLFLDHSYSTPGQQWNPFCNYMLSKVIDTFAMGEEPAIPFLERVVVEQQAYTHDASLMSMRTYTRLLEIDTLAPMVASWPANGGGFWQARSDDETQYYLLALETTMKQTDYEALPKLLCHKMQTGTMDAETLLIAPLFWQCASTELYTRVLAELNPGKAADFKWMVCRHSDKGQRLLSQLSGAMQADFLATAQALDEQ